MEALTCVVLVCWPASLGFVFLLGVLYGQRQPPAKPPEGNGGGERVRRAAVLS